MGCNIGDVEPTGFPALKQIFDRYAEESVTEEQVARVLAPVLAMIRAGRFDRPKGERYEWLIKPLIAGIAVATLIITVAIAQPAGMGFGRVIIPEDAPPLSTGSAPVNSILDNGERTMEGTDIELWKTN
jgi:hypothetical protein